MSELDYHITQPDCIIDVDEVPEWVLENKYEEILDLMTSKYSKEILKLVRRLFNKDNENYISDIGEFVRELEYLKQAATELYATDLISAYPDNIRGE